MCGVGRLNGPQCCNSFQVSNVKISHEARRNPLSVQAEFRETDALVMSDVSGTAALRTSAARAPVTEDCITG